MYSVCKRVDKIHSFNNMTKKVRKGLSENFVSMKNFSKLPYNLKSMGDSNHISSHQVSQLTKSCIDSTLKNDLTVNKSIG